MATKQCLYSRYNPTSANIEGLTLGGILGIFPLRDYANTSQLTANAQPYIDQAIIDAGPTGGKIIFPAATITATKIPLIDGIYYEGVGNKASTVIQPDGVNTPLFVSGPSKTAISFQVQCGVSNMTIKKAPGADTLGSAIEMFCRVGELCLFEKLQISAFPQSGIRLNRGAQPLNISNVHVFGCKEYGIDLRRTSGDIWHEVMLHFISGDNHGKGLIHVQGGGAEVEIMSIKNIKVECITDNTMPCAIDFDGCNNMRVEVGNIAVLGIKPMPTIIKVSSSKIRLLGGLMAARGTALLIDDVEAARQVPYSPDLLGWAYDSNVGLMASGVTVFAPATTTP